MYVIKGKKGFIVQSQNGYETTSAIENASKWTKDKAENVLNSLQGAKKKDLFGDDLRLVEIEAGKDKASDIAKTFADFSKFIEEISMEKVALQEKLSITDKEITDITHYVEFNKPDNERKAKELCDLLYEVTQKRRKVKDRLKEIDCIVSIIPNDIVKRIEMKLLQIHSQKYNPRVLKELFN